MAILRKLISIGNSKAIIIPHDYLEYHRKNGKIIREVGLEINDKIIINPIFLKIEQGHEDTMNQNILAEIKQHIYSGGQQ